MNKRDRKESARYVRWVADEIGLRDWTIDVLQADTDPPTTNSDHKTLGSVDATVGRRVATITLCSDFRDLAPEQQRMVVVHELVHCHLSPLQHQVERDLEGVLGSQADVLFCSSFRRNLEYGIDAITEALVKHLPLIDWPG